MILDSSCSGLGASVMEHTAALNAISEYAPRYPGSLSA